MSDGRESRKPSITQAMIDAYDEYTHLTLDRRAFMEKLTKLAGTGAAAAAIVPMLAVYEGVNHAFNNDTSEARYDREAADLAWGRTVEFLKEKLG